MPKQTIYSINVFQTDLQKPTTDALVKQLKEAFIQTRDETLDIFSSLIVDKKKMKFSTQKQKISASLCNYKHLEESLAISKGFHRMNNQQNQMGLLSEDITLSETIHYAQTRER